MKKGKTMGGKGHSKRFTICASWKYIKGGSGGRKDFYIRLPNEGTGRRVQRRFWPPTSPPERMGKENLWNYITTAMPGGWCNGNGGQVNPPVAKRKLVEPCCSRANVGKGLREEYRGGKGGEEDSRRPVFFQQVANAGARKKSKKRFEEQEKIQLPIRVQYAPEGRGGGGGNT